MTTGIRTSWIRAIANCAKDSPLQSTIINTVSQTLPTVDITAGQSSTSWKSVDYRQQLVPPSAQVKRTELHTAPAKDRQLPPVPTSNFPSDRVSRRQPQLGPRLGPSMGTAIRERVVGRRVRPVRQQQNETDSYDDTTTSSFSPRSIDDLNSSTPSTPDLTSSFHSDSIHSGSFSHTNVAITPRHVTSLYVETKPENVPTAYQSVQNWKTSFPATSSVRSNGTSSAGSSGTNSAGRTSSKIFTFSSDDDGLEASPSPLSRNRHCSPSARAVDRARSRSPKRTLSPPALNVLTSGNSTSIGSDLDSFLIPDEPTNVDEFLVSSLQAEVL